MNKKKKTIFCSKSSSKRKSNCKTNRNKATMFHNESLNDALIKIALSSKGKNIVKGKKIDCATFIATHWLDHHHRNWHQCTYGTKIVKNTALQQLDLNVQFWSLDTLILLNQRSHWQLKDFTRQREIAFCNPMSVCF